VVCFKRLARLIEVQAFDPCLLPGMASLRLHGVVIDKAGIDGCSEGGALFGVSAGVGIYCSRSHLKHPTTPPARPPIKKTRRNMNPESLAVDPKVRKESQRSKRCRTI
jgi:hypothetical protein